MTDPVPAGTDASRLDVTDVHLLVNPAAGGGASSVEAVVDALDRRGVHTIVLDASTPEQAAALAAEAVSAGSRRLIAVGGDGTARIAVGAVAGSSTVLGLVSNGTANDLARALGVLHGSLDDQVERALTDPVRVDAVRSNHGWVASVATLGFSGDVTERAKALRWPRGQLRYSLATLLQLPRLRHLELDVTVDGVTRHTTSTLLAVANTTFFGGAMRIAPDARPDDGLLQVVEIARVTRRTLVRVFPRVFSGRHVDHPDVTVSSGRLVTITGEADVWADGDLLGPLPVTLEVVPGALAVAGAEFG